MKKILLLGCLSIVFVIFFGCEDEKEEDPAEDAFKGISVIETSSSEFPILAAHENGDMIAVMSSQYSSQIVGGVFIPKNGKPFTVWIGDNDLPEMAFFNGNTILFENYTDNTVDIAVIDVNGNTEIHREINYNGGNLKIGATSKILVPNQFDFAQVLSFAGLAISIAGCAYAIIQTAGLALPCGAALINVAITLLPSDNVALETSSSAFGYFASIVGCASSDPFSCAGLVVNTAEDVVNVAETTVESVDDEVSLAHGALIAGSGDIQITLTWDTTDDIDLWVTDPYGELIYWFDPVSASGGYLDYDDRNGYGPENVYWQSGQAPTGTYIVQVDHYYGYYTTNFNVLVQAFNQVKSYSGSLNVNETVDVVTFNSNGTLPRIAINTICTSCNKTELVKMKLH